MKKEKPVKEKKQRKVWTEEERIAFREKMIASRRKSSEKGNGTSVGEDTENKITEQINSEIMSTEKKETENTSNEQITNTEVIMQETPTKVVETHPANTESISAQQPQDFNQLLEIIERQKKLIEEQNVRFEQMLKTAQIPQGQPIKIDINPEFLRPQQDRAKMKFGGTLRKEIPTEDRLPVLKTYIYVGGMYSMNVYLKDGSEKYAPYETPIVFIPFNSEKRGEVWYTYSTYSTFSKKECEFIEASPEFGYSIFSKIKEAQKVNPELIQKVKEAADIVNKMSQIQLINTAQSYHIDITKLSNDEIRHELRSYKLAEILQREQATEEAKLRNLTHHDHTERKL